MAKLTLSDPASLTNESTALATLASNNAATETAMEKTLSRDGTSPNEMDALLDMNSNRIINLPAAISDTEPVRKSEFDDAVEFFTSGTLVAPLPVSLGGTGSIALTGILQGNGTSPYTAIPASSFTVVGSSASVGTATPSNLGGLPGNVLQVHGGANSGVLTVSTSSTTVGAFAGELIFGSTASSGNKIAGALTTQFTSSAATDAGGKISIWTASGTGAASERFTVDQNGKVGIGNSFPAYQLDITAATGQIHLNNTAGVDSGAYLASVTPNNIAFAGGANYNGSSWVAKDATPHVISAVNGQVSFSIDTGKTPGNTYTPTPRLVINSNGKVGIGTASPGAQLEVAGTVRATTATDLTGLLLANSCTFDYNTAGAPVQGMRFITQGANASTKGALTVFQLTSDGSASNQPLYISGAGDVTVGNASAGILDLPFGQVKFPATQNASSNANTLDDYEEGTWTPTWTFVTPGNLSIAYSSQNGYYTKVGRAVSISFAFTTSTFTHTTASGNGLLGGLPFTPCPADSAYRAHSAAGWAGITKVNYTNLYWIASGNSSTLLLGASGSGQAITTITPADTPTGGTLVLGGQLTYNV